MTQQAETSDAIMARLLALHPRRIDLSLGRIERLLAALDHPERNLPPVIHVAGTNGKGSTVAFMRASLEAAGLSAHVYTSPHLVRFHERIRLGDKPHGTLVSEAELVEALQTCERVNDGAPITVFEITTAAALWLFARHRADVTLLEVGLGGRFDATNVIARPAASVITPVSLDHAEFLGTSLPGVAAEKAGIIKAGAPVVIGWQTPPALDVIVREAERVRAPARIAGQDFNCYEQMGRFVYEDERGLLDLPRPSLRGQHQFENAALAIATLRTVFPDLPHSAFADGLTQAIWPARLQRLKHGPLERLLPAGAELWLDGGHNEDGGRVLAAAMADMEDEAPRPLLMICGSLTTKDTAAFLRPFAGLVQEVFALAIPGDHAARPAAQIAQFAREQGLVAQETDSVEAALATIAARRWPAPPRVLIAGSLYLAGEVLRANATPPD